MNTSGYRRGRLQAVEDSCGPQVHRQGLHRHAPEAEGEPQEVLQGKEVQAPRLEAQEDQGHQEGTHCPREVPQDRQGAEKDEGLSNEEVCRQSLDWLADSLPEPCFSRFVLISDLYARSSRDMAASCLSRALATNLMLNKANIRRLPVGLHRSVAGYTNEKETHFGYEVRRLGFIVLPT